MIELLPFLFSMCAHTCNITPDYTSKNEKAIIIQRRPYFFGSKTARVVYSCDNKCRIIRIEEFKK